MNSSGGHQEREREQVNWKEFRINKFAFGLVGMQEEEPTMKKKCTACERRSIRRVFLVSSVVKKPIGQ